MQYMVVIEEADDGSFGAYVPDLPGCISCGDTREEAVQSIQEAIAVHLEIMREHGDEIPIPKSTAAIVNAA